MPFSQGQETALNTISGQVMVKESRVGIPGLVVAISSSASSTSILSSPSSAAVVTMGNQLASAVTRADGSFELIFNGEVPTSTNPPEKLPDLQLSVLAPEEPGVMPQNLVLFSAVLPRERAKELLISAKIAKRDRVGTWISTRHSLIGANGEDGAPGP